MKLINIGCGQKLAQCGDWLNVDMNQNKSLGIRYVNLLKKFPFEDGEFQVVYHSQVLEHFPKDKSLDFMKNCHRILAPGGKIRVVVPDLEFLCKKYISLLDECLTGNPTRQVEIEYQWILLQMYDQTVRNKSGGMMRDFLENLSGEDQKLLAHSLGRVGSSILKNKSGRSKISDLLKKFIMDPGKALSRLISKSPLQSEYEKVGRFRMGGEIHYWMYDFYSLKSMMMDAGFTDIKKKSPYESDIECWDEYCLDVLDGQVCDPGSLFVEASKI